MKGGREGRGRRVEGGREGGDEGVGEGGFLRRRRGRDGWEKDMNILLYSSVNRYHTNKYELIHVHDTLDNL